MPDPTTEKRDVWLFHQAYANSVGPLCLQTLSMLDLNADGVTDRHDLDLYMAAYEEYTRR